MALGKICIISGGILTVLMVIFHSQFYRLFGWKEEFEKVGLKSSKIFYTIHVALILLFLIFSFLSFVFAGELSHPNGFGFWFCLLYSMFWLWRGIWQIVYFIPPKKISDKKLRIMSLTLIVVFFLLSIAYALPLVL